ncbi:uncharacterized protein EI90DRAFT_222013 [Cantharellus anzutake]|uniref:uncharacterized protein n=1 Tax=Cantharellus anzutake TaxID=1750568 RepID=UPI0019045812|nr:uncharacterized protein EI90DRAFT_222013 [Cantharellus anzutake]KAF8316710.1 hypothetical protein EI90DRAFT_222013 [Cantharellus anzutake]
MTLLISPLVLLFDTTLTSPSILPSITAMVSHAVLHGGLRQSNGPRKVLENALFNLIFSVSRAGQISQHDLDRFLAAWTMVLPCIRVIGADPRDVGTESAPPFSEQVSGLHPSTAQSPAAAETSGFAPTPTVAHSPITTPSTIFPQSAPNAPDDRDEEFTLGPKGPQQNSPFTQVPSSAGQKRGRGGRYDSQLGKCPRKRVTSGAGHIQEGTVASISIYSLDTCKTWPHVTSVDKTLDVPELNPDARPKLLHSVDLPVIFVDEGRTSRMETFFFPYCEHSPSLQKLRHFLESPQHDSKYWKPVLMTTQQALAMDVQRFQGMVNDGTPIVLVDQLGQVPFLAHSFINFQSKVQCIGKFRLSLSHPRPPTYF